MTLKILESMTYTITLQDFPEIPEDTRVKAEDHYRRALEKALGGADAVEGSVALAVKQLTRLC